MPETGSDIKPPLIAVSPLKLRGNKKGHAMRSLKMVLLTGTGRSTLVCAEFNCGPAYVSFKVGWNM
nr:MAG TPA: hypothetical protein [Caudoviricetes sp.]